MAITAAQVKELRELTGAGMMDCKKALAETDGNMEAAVDVLRKSGAVKAEKKASRIAAEGICRAAVNGTTGVVVEVNSQRQTSLLRTRYSRHLFSRSLIRHLLHHLLVARMARMLRHFSERMVLRKPLLTRQQQSERSYHSVDSRSFQAM